MLYKIITHEIKSKNLLSISLIFTIVTVFVGWWGKDVIETYFYIVIFSGILGLLSWYLFIKRVKEIKRNLERFKNYVVTAKIIKRVRSRYIIFFEFSLSVNGKDYVTSIRVPKTLKSKGLRKKEGLDLLYNPDDPNEVYIYDLFL